MSDQNNNRKQLTDSMSQFTKEEKRQIIDMYALADSLFQAHNRLRTLMASVREATDAFTITLRHPTSAALMQRIPDYDMMEQLDLMLQGLSGKGAEYQRMVDELNAFSDTAIAALDEKYGPPSEDNGMTPEEFAAAEEHAKQIREETGITEEPEDEFTHNDPLAAPVKQSALDTIVEYAPDGKPLVIRKRRRDPDPNLH